MLLKKLGAPKNHHWVDDLGSHLEVPLVAASQGMYDLTQHPPDAPWTFWTLEFQLSSMVGRFLMAPETSAAPLEKTVFSPLMMAFLVRRNLLFPSWGNLGHYFTYSWGKRGTKKTDTDLSSFGSQESHGTENSGARIDRISWMVLQCWHIIILRIYIPIYSQSDPILFTIIPRLYHIIP